MVSDITDRLLPQIEEWQNHPLVEMYPIAFIDAVTFPFTIMDKFASLHTLSLQLICSLTWSDLLEFGEPCPFFFSHGYYEEIKQPMSFALSHVDFKLKIVISTNSRFP